MKCEMGYRHQVWLHTKYFNSECSMTVSFFFSDIGPQNNVSTTHRKAKTEGKNILILLEKVSLLK